MADGGKQATVQALVAWLKDHAPNDYVMPVGEHKAPRYRHANGAWSWYALQKHFCRAGIDPVGDVGILLCDLCVVDVDCEAVCTELRRRFPVLDATMSERTRNGHHFFFRRSKRADEGGYYDGAAQRLPKVDFKTICSNGTSGFIVVAPSTNKTWVNSFEDTLFLPEIPDDLLDAVAKPTHAPVSMTVRFQETGEEEAVEASAVIMKLAYAHLFAELGEMHVPIGSRAEFDALLKVLAGAPLDLTSVDDRRPFVQRLTRLADFLGVKVKDCRIMQTEWMELVRLYDTHPEMARAVNAGTTVNVDADLVRSTFVDPVDLGSDELFAVCRAEYGAPALRSLDDAFADVPSTTLQLLREYPGELVLAGGFATGCLCDYAEEGSDVDLFVVGTAERANEIMRGILHTVADVGRVFRTGNAVTLFIYGDPTPIQVILKLHATPADVITAFDLEPAKAAMFIRAGDGQPAATVTHGWLECVRANAFPVLSTTWSSSSTYRVMKYAAKGFQPYICGLRPELRKFTRTFAGSMLARAELCNALEVCEGMGELLRAERYFRTENVVGAHAPLTVSTIACVTSLFRGIRKSDYSTYTRWGIAALTRLTHWCLRAAGFSTPRNRSAFVRLTCDNAAEVLSWRPAAASPGRTACFYKADANLKAIVEE
jgi:hypothetical protein